MFDNVGDWVMAWAGDPLTVLNVLGVLAWVVLIGAGVAAVLGAALSEARPWMPTTPGPEAETEEMLAEWQDTQPMPLYGSQGPVEPLPMQELANGSTVQDGTLRSRPRSAWLG